MENQLPYAKQSINQLDVNAVTKALMSGTVTRGPTVETFEQAIASYCDVPYAIAFNSGSTALQAAAFAAEVSDRDRVYTTPNTFISSVGSFVQKGATPVFVDIDRATGNLSLDQLRTCINEPTTRGREIIVPVHFSGIAIDMGTLEQMVARPDTMIIEDAAHALGSEYPTGEKVGSCAYSDMTIFSFHPAKTITTGEGGMVTTYRADLAERLRLFRNNGIVRDESFDPWYYESKELTGNYHLTEFQAALGLSQFERLSQFKRKRSSLVQAYRKHLADLPIKLCDPEADARSCYHLFVVQVPGLKRSELMLALKEQGIHTQYHYIPIYRHPVMRALCGEIDAYFPEMEGYYKEALSLPLFADMETGDVERVCQSLAALIKG